MVAKVQGLQVLGLVLRGEVKLQSSRGGQGWTWSKQIFSMGTRFIPACKVFVNMAARNLLLNFGTIFGGLQSYIIRSRMEVVVVKMVLKCKITNCI
jgi:hypothetical protein